MKLIKLRLGAGKAVFNLFVHKWLFMRILTGDI